MEESNKYYTPEIEEFHIGFICEALTRTYSNKDSFTEKWKRVKIGGSNSQDELITAQFLHTGKLDLSRIRVKYLDKEDIESLGFKCVIEDSDFNLIHHEKDNCIIKKFFKSRFKSSNGIQTKSTVIYYNIYYKLYSPIKDYKIFEGRIKNKSELIKVLKMLGIYENSK